MLTVTSREGRSVVNLNRRQCDVRQPKEGWGNGQQTTRFEVETKKLKSPRTLRENP